MVRRRTVCLLCVLAVASLVLHCGGADPRSGEPGRGSQSQQGLFAHLGSASKSSPERPLLLSLQLASVIRQTRAVLGDSVVAPDGPFWSVLDSVALSLSPKLFMETDANKIVRVINDHVFSSRSLSFDRDRDNIESLFPHTVEQNGKGSCVGMSLLYLLLAEKLGMPIYGVLVPEHLFVRFDNGTDRINIETIKQGRDMPDAWYRERYAVPESSGVYLRNLSVAEVMGVVHYNLGNSLLARKQHRAAVGHFGVVTTALPQYAEGWGNLGVALDMAGESVRALDALRTARRIDPELAGVDRSLGALLLRAADYRAAAGEYAKALKRDPYDPDALFGMAMARYHLREFGQARANLDAALSVRSEFEDARELLARIEAADSTGIR